MTHKLESNIQKLVRMALTPWGRYFRANVGKGWQGRKVIKVASPGMVHVEPGDVVLKGARPFDTGLPEGFSDLVGITRVTVTPDMVGQVVGLFTAVEVKSPTGRQREGQAAFERVVRQQGGAYFIARSADDVARHMEQLQQQRLL